MSNLNDIFFTPAANQELTYDQVLEDVQRYFAENHASTIAEAGEGNAERATSLLKELMEHYIVKRKYALDGLSTKELCSKLYEDMAGYSFLKKWIYKPGVEEVNINAYNDIEVIESSGRSIKIPDKFSSPQHAIDVIRRMLNACGMVIDDTMPSIVGFLDKNIRISVDKTPIVDADVGVNASIRIVNQQTVSEEKLLNSGSATAEMLHFLTACIRYGVSVCIAGSTGSGKTTIMAWLLSNVPNNRRLITIEEGSREFDLVKRDAQGNILNSVVHLLTRPSENPALNINQDFLLERVLRKHPDVIGVGEMRSAAESLSAAESSRTGHTVCTTIHSNSCNSTYRRMMTLAKRKYNMDDSILMQIMVPFHCQPAAAHPVAWRKPLPDFQFVSCSAPSLFINSRTPKGCPAILICHAAAASAGDWMLSVFSIRSAISTSTKSFPAKWPVWMMTRSFFNWINSFSRRTRLSAASALSLSVSLAVTTRCHFCRNSVACSMSFFCRSYSVRFCRTVPSGSTSSV